MTFCISRKSWPVALSALVVLSACTSTPTVVRSTDAEVAVRYDGIVNGIDDAKQMAEKACAARNKTARLRRVSDQGLGLHYGYFDCISATGLN
jgi:imidazolonepropionase-like amidohydrolase